LVDKVDEVDFWVDEVDLWLIKLILGLMKLMRCTLRYQPHQPHQPKDQPKKSTFPKHLGFDVKTLSFAS
jgi:hypothetical protein